MVKKSSKSKRTVKEVALLFLISILVSGCVSADSDKSTENVTVHTTEVAEPPEESLTDDSEESPEASTESSTPVSYITGSKMLEPLVPSLWGRMLQYCGITQVNTSKYDDWGQANKDFLKKQFDAHYEIETYLTKIAASRAGFTEIYTFYDDFGCSYSWRWNEHDESGNILTVSPDLYPKADKYWEFNSPNEIRHYSTSDFINSLIAPAKVKTSGTIHKTAYEKGKNWSEELEWMPYGMWGSVMKEAGKLYMEENGTILGRLNGQAYMMGFENDTMTGTFWVCLDGSDPVQMVFVIDYEGFIYEVQIIEDAMFNETDRENAWLSMEFDLVTEQLKK